MSFFQTHRDASRIDALAARFGVHLADPARSQLAGYAERAASWGARTDLTAARDAATLAELLFVDAFVMLADPVLVPEATGTALVDVGAGAGAPTIPVVVLRPALRAVLVEPRRRRVAFLRSAIGADEDLVRRVRVYEGRVAPGAPEVPGAPFQLALSRATFPPPEWLRVGLELAPRVLLFTAGDAPPPAPPGVGVARHIDYAVPSTGAPRAITLYERQG